MPVSGLGDDIASQAAESIRKPAPQHPGGWEPGVEWNGTTGRITAPTDSRLPDWRSLLELWDFDPEQYEVVEPVQVRTWDAAVGNGEVRRMWYHRAGIRRKRAGAADVAELVKLVHRAKPVARPASDNGGAYFLALNDWQIGKRGTAAAIDRIVAAIDASAARARRLKPASVWLAALGDLGENCDGHYAMQSFEVEHDRRDQGILARRLILYAIDAHRGIAPVYVPAVAGNHGEHRKDGKAFTSFGDNDDVAWVEQVAEATALNPDAYGNVTFLIPREQLTLTVQPVEGGPIVGLAHGHQAKRGGTTAQTRIAAWWSGQAFGMRPVGDASILVTAHAHHFSIIENGPRTHIQAPTVDSGSQWFAETAGMDSKPGMLSFTVTANGWDDLKLL
jgi:hypothetical protein